MSLGQLLGRIWRLRWFIVASSVICGLTAAGASRLLPKRYAGVAEVSMDAAINSADKSYTVSAKQMDSYVKSEAALAKDYRVTGRVVDALNWTSSNEFAEQYRKSKSSLDFRSWLALRISANTSIEFREGDGGFLIIYSGYDPQEARVMAGLVRQAFIDYLLEARRTQAQSRFGWVQDRMAELERRIRELERESSDFGRSKGVTLTPEGVSLAEMRLRSAAAAVPRGPSTHVIAAVPNPARSELIQTEGEIASLSKNLGPNHPQMQDLRKRRDALARMVAAAERAQTTARPSSDTLSIDRARTEYFAQMGNIAQAKRYFAELQTLRNEYQNLQKSAANQQFDTTTIQAGAKALTEPTASGKVYYPNVGFSIPAAFGFGAALAILTGLLWSLLNLRVHSTKDLQDLDLQTFE